VSIHIQKKKYEKFEVGKLYKHCDDLVICTKNYETTFDGIKIGDNQISNFNKRFFSSVKNFHIHIDANLNDSETITFAS